MYVHGFDTGNEAESYRAEAAKGAYRTSSPVQVPLALLNQAEFMDVVSALVASVVDVDYPDDAKQ